MLLRCITELLCPAANTSNHSFKHFKKEVGSILGVMRNSVFENSGQNDEQKETAGKRADEEECSQPKIHFHLKSF